MKPRFRTLAVLLSFALAAVGTFARAADPKSPDAVKNALRVLAYVQSDMASKLPSHAYARLPHECQEFREASEAMRDAVAGDPAPFKAQVESAMGKALAASDHVAEISKSNDEAKITNAVAAVDAALQDLNRLFPEGLRPVPGRLGRGPGRGPGGPPPDLR
jgi:cytochrome c556